MALNCFHHAALGTTPFRTLYGRDPPLLVAAPPSAQTPTKVAELIHQRGKLLIELRSNLERAQQRMRDSANKHRRDVEFEVGDLVWLKLQPYRQHSVAKPLSAKLTQRFYGPFEVLQRVGPVAYRLRLPDGSRIHDVFHVSLLKEFVAGESSLSPGELPEAFMGVRPIVHPLSFLDSQVMWHEGKTVEHVLVRWSDGSDSLSWEPLDAIRKCFPTLSLEAKGVVNGGRADKSNHISTEEPSDINKSAEIPEEEGSTTAEDRAEEEEQSSRLETGTATRTLRPRNQIKPPQKFANYVAK